RNPEGLEDTLFFSMSLVLEDKQVIWLRTHTDGPIDNHLGVARPVPVTLDDLDLGPTVFIDSTSNAVADRKDELLVYDNSVESHNKTPQKIFFRVGGEWQEDDGSTYPVASTEVIAPSSSIVLRKSATLDGEPVRWVNSPRY
ncbi:MAG: TIGR02597 family protein, partial [Verrucomicrobiota bacterium]